MNEPELTFEAKVAIRTYMLKVVVIPSFILTVLGFTIGFFVNDVAKKDAYTRAYEQASSTILKLTSEASQANTKVQITKNNVEKTVKDVQEILYEAETIRAKLRTAEAFQKSEEIVKEIAESLVKRDDFKKLFVGTTQIIHTEDNVDGCPNPERKNDLIVQEININKKSPVYIHASMIRYHISRADLHLMVDGKEMDRTLTYTSTTQWEDAHLHWAGVLSPGFHTISLRSVNPENPGVWGCKSSWGSIDTIVFY